MDIENNSFHSKQKTHTNHGIKCTLNLQPKNKIEWRNISFSKRPERNSQIISQTM